LVQPPPTLLLRLQQPCRASNGDMHTPPLGHPLSPQLVVVRAAGGVSASPAAAAAAAWGHLVPLVLQRVTHGVWGAWVPHC
jgi:hypothetical protein